MVRYNIANMPRNPRNSAWTGQGGPTAFIHLTDAAFTIRGKRFPLTGSTQIGVRHRILGVPEIAPTGKKRARPKGKPDIPNRASPVRGAGIGGGGRDREDAERWADGGARGGNVQGEGGVTTGLKPGKRKRPKTKGGLGKIEGFGGERKFWGGKRARGERGERGVGSLKTNTRSVMRQQEADERGNDKDSESSSESDSETSDDSLDDLTKELDGMDSSGEGADNGDDNDGDQYIDDDGKTSASQRSSTAAPKTEGKGKEGSEVDGGDPDSESSDSDESSGSVGAAASEFEQFLSTIKGGVRLERGLNIDAEVTGVEGAENDEVKADDKGLFSGTTSQAGARNLPRDGALPQGDDVSLANKLVVGGLLHSKAVTASCEGGGWRGGVGASSIDDGPSKGELAKGRSSRLGATTPERIYGLHCNDDDDADDGGCRAGGGGGDGGGGGGDMDQEEEEEETGERKEVEEEEVGSDLERDFDNILGEPGQKSVSPNHVVDNSPAADATESSDSDESSGSIGAAALEFEQFLDTIKGGVGGEGGLNMDAQGTAVEGSDNADDGEVVLEASPLEGAGNLARDGVLLHGDREVLAQKPVGELVHGQALTPSRGGASSAAGEKPSEGEHAKERRRRVETTASERDCEPHSSEEVADGGGGGGGGGGGQGAGNMEKEVGSDLARDFGYIVESLGQNIATSNDVVAQSPAANATESSDSDESSDSIGAAALDFEQFLDTIKRGVGGDGGSNVDAAGTAVEESGNDEAEADGEVLSDTPPLEGTGGVALDGVLPQGDGGVLTQKPVSRELVHGRALTSSRDGDGARTAAGASPSNERPGEVEHEKRRDGRMTAATPQLDCEEYSSDYADSGGGSSGSVNAGDIAAQVEEEEEEEEEVGSGLERDFGGILENPRRNSATSDDAVDQSLAADAMESSDSDESSDSVGAAALEFELFLDTMKGGAGREGGSNVDAAGTTVENSKNDATEADEEEALVGASPLKGAEDLVRSGVLRQGDGEVLAQKPVVGELVQGQASTSNRDGGGAPSASDASSSDEGPSEGELEKTRERRATAAISQRDCEQLSSEEDANNGGGVGGGRGGGGRGVGGGGGGGGDDAGDLEEEVGEEEEEVGFDLERECGGTLENLERHRAKSDDGVDQSPAANSVESSDSDESSDSAGGAALEFEQFLDTIKGGVEGEGRSNMDAESTAVEDGDNDEIDAGDEEALSEVPPLQGLGNLARDGALPRGDGEVLEQKRVFEGLAHGKTFTPSRDRFGATSRADSSSVHEISGEGDLEKRRASGLAAAAAERDCESHCSDSEDNDIDGGDDTGVVEEEEGEEEEEEEVGSDLERGFDDILEEPVNSTFTSDGVVDQSPVANPIDSALSPSQMGAPSSRPLPEVDGGVQEGGGEDREVVESSSESSDSEDSGSEPSGDDQAIKGFEDFLSGL